MGTHGYLPSRFLQELCVHIFISDKSRHLALNMITNRLEMPRVSRTQNDHNFFRETTLIQGPLGQSCCLGVKTGSGSM